MSIYNYTQTTDELYRRIKKLAEEKPEVLELESAWGLHAAGLKSDDLQPSLAQASYALAKVQSEMKAKP